MCGGQASSYCFLQPHGCTPPTAGKAGGAEGSLACCLLPAACCLLPGLLACCLLACCLPACDPALPGLPGRSACPCPGLGLVPALALSRPWPLALGLRPGGAGAGQAGVIIGKGGANNPPVPPSIERAKRRQLIKQLDPLQN